MVGYYMDGRCGKHPIMEATYVNVIAAMAEGAYLLDRRSTERRCQANRRRADRSGSDRRQLERRAA